MRTFQINQLFGELTPLQSLALAVSQPRSARRGAGGGRWAATRASPPSASALLAQFRLADMPTGRRASCPTASAACSRSRSRWRCRPRVLLLDEPAAGVPAGERAGDPRHRGGAAGRVSVLLIEHDMDLVFSFARRITVLVNGAVLAEGTPEEIAADPRVKAVYLGEHGGASHG